MGGKMRIDKGLSAQPVERFRFLGEVIQFEGQAKKKKKKDA